jgi:hypothetical protein
MARLAFKPDSSFFRKIAIGAVGTRAVVADLATHGHQIDELERGSTDTKLWKDVKRKRVRIPDLVCRRCGLRIESRAKTKAELSMSHSPSDEARAWDFGMVDADWVAFPVCEPSREESWTASRLGATESYWHERDWIRWQTGGRINYFTVASFRAVPSTKSTTKGVTEGSETAISWPATFATRAGTIDSITGRKLTIWPLDGGRRTSRSIPLNQQILVESGETIEVHQVLGSAVSAIARVNLSCPGRLPRRHIAYLLSSRERTQRFTGIKLARLRGESGYQVAARELVADNVEDVYIRLEAASYLTSVCGESAHALFRPHLESLDSQARLETVIALGEASTHEAVEILSELLDDSGQPHYLRSAAAWCLGRIGDGASIERLMRAFADVNPSIREQALESLAFLGASATSILLSGLELDDPAIAAGAAEALRQQQPLSRAVIEQLARGLRSEDPSPWSVWLFGHLPRDQVASAIADLQQAAPPLHYAISLLWSFVESWIARHWELCPTGYSRSANGGAIDVV